MAERKIEMSWVALITTVLTGVTFLGMFYKGIHDVKKAKKYFKPTNAHTEYVNNDTLPDLVYKTGEVYLQTKEGTFVNYNDVLQQEKAKLDSAYQTKKDSLRKVFENKLEKELK